MKATLLAIIILILILMPLKASADQYVLVMLASGYQFSIEPDVWTCADGFCTFWFVNGARLTIPASALTFVQTIMY